MGYKIYADNELIFASDWNDPDYQLISPTIKMEVNKAGSAEFTILPRHPFYNSLEWMKTRVKVTRDDEIIFVGRVLSDETDVYNQRKVYCEGSLAYLVDSILQPCKGSRTAEEHFKMIVESHNSQVEDSKKFTIGKITINECKEKHIFGEDNYRESFSALESDLIDAFGGYLRVRFENDIAYLDYLKDYGSECSQTIEFGQNLLDLSNKHTGEDLFTVLLPIGKDKLTIENTDSPSKYTHNGKYLENTAAISSYGKIVKVQDFGDVTDVTTLLSKAEKYIDENYKGIPPELTIKALDLHELDSSIRPFNLGDSITIKSTPHHVERTLICASVALNVKAPENTQYVLSDPNQITIRKDRTLTGSSSSTASTASTAKRGGASGIAASETLSQFITEENGTLTIKDKVLRLESLPGGTLGQITAALDIGDGHIIASVSNELKGLSNTITQTEKKLNSTISSTKEGLESQIEQTAGSLTSTISSTKEGLESQIKQTASDINLSVSDKISGVQGRIDLCITNVDGLRQSVATIDTDVTNINSKITDINSEITNIKNLYSEEAIITLLEGGYIKVAALTATSGDIGNLTAKTFTFGESTVKKEAVTVVTDFTQASTYGAHLTSSTPPITVLCASKWEEPKTSTPDYGEKVTFNGAPGA